jgi:hypothetical protein
MGTCDCCGNAYDRLFSVKTHDGDSYQFDSVECAAQMIAPRCAHCGCTILGHGIDADTETYCCSNCARDHGIQAARDNVRDAVG